MFDSQQKSTGTGYTATAGFLIVAFIFSPAALIFSGHTSYLAMSLAVVGSAICVTLAWVTWKKASRLSMPSIETHGENSK